MLNFPTGKTTDGMSTSYSGEPPGYITDLATTRPCAAAHCKTPSRAQRVHSSATNRSPLEREPHPLLARKAEIARSRLWRVVAIAPQCHLIPNLEMMPPRCMRHSAFPFRSQPFGSFTQFGGNPEDAAAGRARANNFLPALSRRQVSTKPCADSASRSAKIGL